MSNGKDSPQEPPPEQAPVVVLDVALTVAEALAVLRHAESLSGPEALAAAATLRYLLARQRLAPGDACRRGEDRCDLTKTRKECSVDAVNSMRELPIASPDDRT